MRLLRPLLAFMAIGLGAQSASAHRIGIPVTTIEWNASSDVWEITHRLSAHDLEKTLGRDARLDELATNLGAQGELGRFVEDNFTIEGADLNLVYVGAELDGDQVWIYFELNAPDETIKVDSNLLLGVEDTSFALVNVKSGSTLKSLIYSERDAAKPVMLQRPEGSTPR